MDAVQMRCPACNAGSITLLPGELLGGAAFGCSACGASVSLNPQSRDALADGLTAYRNLEQLVQRQPPG